jgi:segregation and condensation protein B
MEEVEKETSEADDLTVQSASGDGAPETSKSDEFLAPEPGGGPETPDAEPLPVEPDPGQAAEFIAPEAPGGPETGEPAPEAPPIEPAPVSVDELLPATEESEEPVSIEDSQLKAVLEAIVYVADEPLTLAQLAAALQQPGPRIAGLLEQLIAEFDKPEHGVTIREVAGGYKMATKAEHHEAVRNFVKSLKPPLKLSLPALETLAVIAYKQPVTAPEIMEIRGVQGAGVLKTLLDRKLIAVAGRKNVIGKPILYKTTKEFMIQFGLKDLAELPSLKEFEEIRRMAFSDAEPVAEAEPPVETALEPQEEVAAELSPEAQAEAAPPEAAAPEAAVPEAAAETPAASTEPETPVAEPEE